MPRHVHSIDAPNPIAYRSRALSALVSAWKKGPIRAVCTARGARLLRQLINLYLTIHTLSFSGNHPLLVLLGLRNHAHPGRHDSRQVRRQAHPGLRHPLQRPFHHPHADRREVRQRHSPHRSEGAGRSGPGRGLPRAQRHAGAVGAGRRALQGRLPGVRRGASGHGVRHDDLRPDPALQQQRLGGRVLLLRGAQRALVPRLVGHLLQRPPRSPVHLGGGAQVPARAAQPAQAQEAAASALEAPAALDAGLGPRRGDDRPRLGLPHDDQRPAQVHEQRHEVLHREQRIPIVPALPLHVAG